MFLDPEPKRQKMSASPFFSAQTPADSPGDQRWRIKRKPLQEQTLSQINQKPTVRLVVNSRPSTGNHDSSTSVSDSECDDIRTAKEIKVHRYDRAPPRLARVSTSAVVQEASAPELGSQGSPTSSQLSQNQNVSDSNAPTNEAQKLTLPPSITLLPKYSDHVVPKTAWHRRSGSSGNYSTSPTLKEADSSTFAYSRRSERFSQGTTLRGTPTPTPTEQEVRERIGAEPTAAPLGPAHALQPVQETSPEHTTIRAVPPSVKSSLNDDQVLASPQSAPSLSDAEAPPEIPRKSSRRRSSASSLPPPLTIRKASSPPDSLKHSEADFPEPSSPIFVIYDSDSTRPRSRSQPLHFSPSIESIQSRLQYPSVIRLQTGRSLATSDSWASLRPRSSDDTLPPLQIPKLRHRPAALSLGSSSAFASSSKMASEDFDILPYPRNHFSSHLSTIASESDRRSRSTSQHLSHFSLGSGVLTGDDASSIPPSGSWPRARRESAPVSSVASDASPVPPGTSSEEGAGDMTLGIFREESAKPQPLFRPSAPGEARKYDGPLPPIPPIPKSRDSDENFDTVSELQSPALRPKRSGYSLRQRSNSTPSHSNSHSRHLSQISNLEIERGSHASSLFPTWAKHFYGGTAALISASKTSLSTNSTPRPQQRQQHLRGDSQWTEHSYSSRLGTGYNELDNGSPTSSHFLPSIFRPRTRARANTERQSRSSSRLRRSKRSRPSGDDDGRPDSLAIFNDPLPDSRDGRNLPSGEPKFGELKDSPDPRRPLPRKYSKQRQWDKMEFPRPMTKDRLSDFAIQDPRLAPTKRSSYRLSTWRAPSFVESLDSLVRSKCNRQILLFALGFICPLLWMLAAILPLPKKPISADDFEKLAGSEEDVQAAMMKHEAGDAERRYNEERQWMKARWWKRLNRIMSVIGVLVIGAVIALAIVATR
ncbi:hypothetical protein LTR36_000136 [Oleoguttula mirabilis]|uniref:Serine-rich protein n=1 Tax=Oleoguttula mirabilis TaxID=1507867 RepID=A0AAV9JXY6_9PEZI|nr:hypothetical protein LTR36_000136 [Oleoguttula mirabilis]